MLVGGIQMSKNTLGLAMASESDGGEKAKPVTEQSDAVL